MNDLYLKTKTRFIVLLLVATWTMYSCHSTQTKEGKNQLNDSVAATSLGQSDSVAMAHPDTAAHTEAVIPASKATETPTQEVVSADTAKVDSTKKYVFLTFDDGPQPGTMNVYHNLKALGIKATFFMVGLHATFGKIMHETVDTIRDGYPEILLANHSYTHANGRYFYFYHHTANCFEDFMKAQKDLNVQKKIIRLPGNSAWVLGSSMSAHDLVRPVCKMLDSAGYSVIGWDLEWSFKRDPTGPGSVPIESADRMVSMVEYALNHNRTHRKNSLVLLSHDRMFHHQNYSDSLYKFMAVLKKRNPNYIFETVENYPGVKKD